MHRLFDQNEITVHNLNDLISGRTEESIHLEFKSAGALEMNDKCKKEVSVSVSSMANSDGGTIIYGILEANHQASEITPINGKTFTKEWLEQVVQSKIQRQIRGLKIIPIRLDADLNSVYVVNIPRSIDAPHRASDGRFYKRSNFLSIMMEEYEVRDLYNRANRTELAFAGEPKLKAGGSSSSGGELQQQDFSLIFEVQNIGNTIERNYKLQLWTPALCTHRGTLNSMWQYFEKEEDGYNIFSIPNKSPLFPGEKSTFIECNLIVKIGYYLRVLKGQEFIRARLYFSGGQEKYECGVLEMLDKDYTHLRTSFPLRKFAN